MPTIRRPAGHHVITPGFIAPKGTAAKAAEFIEKAFGGKVTERYDGPDGSIAHCEVMLGDSIVMFGDCMPGYDPMPASLSYYVDDAAAVDEAYRRALAAGATSETEPMDQFYGYRSACVKDVAGNRWNICAVIEELTPEEIQRRMASM